MSGPVLLISDLHLEADRPDILHDFFAFLDNQAAGAGSLYILGDFFNVWIGDDHVTPLSQQVAAALRRLAAAGTDIFLMHGNRDFLLGQDYAMQCAARLIAEPYLLSAFGQDILLMHGDALCTRDTDYMAFRSLVRSPGWQEDFLAKSLQERAAFATQARAQSKAMSSNKAEDIMDVTPQAVVAVMQEHGVSTLLHGHTHRPAVHKLELEGNKAARYVLGDWDKQGWYISVDQNGPQLISLQR